MKYTLAIVALLNTVSAERPVWSLRSVNDHRTDAGVQKLMEIIQLNKLMPETHNQVPSFNLNLTLLTLPIPMMISSKPLTTLLVKAEWKVEVSTIELFHQDSQVILMIFS